MAIRRRRIHSIALRAAVFLLLGAVVNVALAWGCMIVWPAREDDDWILVAENQAKELLISMWNIEEPLRLEEIESGAMARFGWIEYHATYFPEELDHDIEASTAWFTVLNAGWPAKSFRGDYRSPPAHRYQYVGAIMIPQSWRPAYGRITLWSYFPYLPIWPGFAINTLFYATILWLLFAFPFTLRRWRRIRRGLCAKCAYPVGASEVCTECGAAVSRPSGAAGCSHG